MKNSSRKLIKELMENLIEERKNFLSLIQTYDEECSFPSSSSQLKEEAEKQLRKEGKLP